MPRKPAPPRPTAAELDLLRVIWRLMHKAPPLADTLASWEVALSKVTHLLLYVLMLGIPMSGWLMHSAYTGGQPVSWFGLFNWPGLATRLVNAVQNRNYPLVQGSILVIAALFIAINMGVELLYGVIDPRIRRRRS